MARKKTPSSPSNSVEDFRHQGARRKNNPPAGMAPTFEVRERETTRYSYDPHLDPQLVWAGKAEHTSFEVDVVSLHIHERISTKAILRAVQRPELVQADLFGETPLSADQQVEFYKHEVGWANRLILGDSLLVMNSLLVKEGMAGKVQMVYMDPPYGIKYASNFQPRIDRRDVKDADEDLTHEPEQIKAYRDTWKLGIHSYLTYLRDRLLLARELLAESGSIFVQINDENLHLVRCLLDEVFGRENFVAVVAFAKTAGQTARLLPSVSDYLLWYAKDSSLVKYRRIFLPKSALGGGAEAYHWVELPDGVRRRGGSSEKHLGPAASGWNVFRADNLTSQSGGPSTRFPVAVGEQVFTPAPGYWKTNAEGLLRLGAAERLAPIGKTLSYVRYLDDFPVFSLGNSWWDTGIAGFGEPKIYAVQTNTKVIERCILMTTDPGDLVLDPTCGSGTTAYCAEKWGRRWITCDTSRVAVAIARQRLMTAKFDYYELLDPERGPAGGFKYETVPHITLESIAKNTEIDAIAAKYQPQIDQALADLNRALVGATGRSPLQEWEVPREVPHPLWPEDAASAYESLWNAKKKLLLLSEEVRDGLQRVAQALGTTWSSLCDVPNTPPKAGWPQSVRQAYLKLQDLKKQLLEAEPQVPEWLRTVYTLTGHRWETLCEVPEPVPGEDWPPEAREALRRFWEAKHAKRREIDESIQRNAPQETLYDRPKVVRGLVRVSGPFTVEAIPVPAVEDPTQAPIPQFEETAGADLRALPDEDSHAPVGSAVAWQEGRVSDRAGDYLTTMLNLLSKQGGVLFPGGKKLELENLRALNLGLLHAEGESKRNGTTLRVAISFGPPYGPVMAFQVQEAIPTAKMNGYAILIFAGFSFDPEAQALIQKAPVAGLEVHFANIAPDVLVGDLLKTTRASQIFTVFGQPDVAWKRNDDGTYVVELRGVDIYNPLTGQTEHSQGSEVAAWFLDTDYDGKTFHICQAFFPGDPDAWDKLQRALRAQIDPEAFHKMRGTVSFPFEAGEYRRAGVKVIDFRGNEVLRVVNLSES